MENAPLTIRNKVAMIKFWLKTIDLPKEDNFREAYERARSLFAEGNKVGVEVPKAIFEVKVPFIFTIFHLRLLCPETKYDFIVVTSLYSFPISLANRSESFSTNYVICIFITNALSTGHWPALPSECSTALLALLEHAEALIFVRLAQ